MSGENNLYPDNPNVRRRGRRKARPKHLPPHQPPAPDAVRLEAEALARKQAAAAPAAAAFGAKKGAGNALLFHALKTQPVTKPAREEVDDSDPAGG
jgi:hypothetical protein